MAGEDTTEFIRMNADSRVMRYFPKRLSPEESVEFLGRIKRSLQCTVTGSLPCGSVPEDILWGLSGCTVSISMRISLRVWR